MIASPEPPAPGFPKPVVLTAPATKALRKLPAAESLPIVEAIERYGATGAGDVKRLVNIRPPEYRLRVGEYRVRFTLPASGEVLVLRVANRRDAY